MWLTIQAWYMIYINSGCPKESEKMLNNIDPPAAGRKTGIEISIR